MRVDRSKLRNQRGVTLLEVAIVVAIVGIGAALAGTLLTEGLPVWRTRRGAREFSAVLLQCRQMAIAQGVEYRVRMAESDPSLDSSTGSVGAYFVERGNLASNSTQWDILPWDLDGSDSSTGEGTVVITDGGEDSLHGVSIADWGVLSGVDGDDIVFSPRGWLENPASDFDADGYINITFVNKPARLQGTSDEWTVKVSRGGMARLESSRMDPVGASSGTAEASQWATSTSSGYSP